MLFGLFCCVLDLLVCCRLFGCLVVGGLVSLFAFNSVAVVILLLVGCVVCIDLVQLVVCGYCCFVLLLVLGWWHRLYLLSLLITLALVCSLV